MTGHDRDCDAESQNRLPDGDGSVSPDRSSKRGGASAGSSSTPVRADWQTPLQRDTVAGYRLIRVLGKGAMGVVWEAEEECSKNRVALKVMRQDHEVDENHRRMFRRETEALARLDHPTIAGIFASDHTKQGHEFFAMEMVLGETLDQWLLGRPKTYDAPELELRLRLFQKICGGVHYAHQRGVVHRDIKPSNLVIGGTETSAEEHASTAQPPAIKILDFGLASITDSDLEATTIPDVGVIRGTLQYMSPEQARCDGEVIGVRSDIYSLGVILFEMLAGVRPYEVSHSALAEALRIICEEPPSPIRKHWKWSKKLTPDPATILGKALEKDANQRYASAAELGDDVENYLNSRPIKARPRSAAYRLQKSSARMGGYAIYFAARFVVEGVSRVLSTPSLIARLWVAEKPDNPSSTSKS